MSINNSKVITRSIQIFLVNQLVVWDVTQEHRSIFNKSKMRLNKSRHRLTRSKPRPMLMTKASLERREWRSTPAKFSLSSRETTKCRKLLRPQATILSLRHVNFSVDASSIVHPFGNSIELQSHQTSTGRTWASGQSADVAKLGSYGLSLF